MCPFIPKLTSSLHLTLVFAETLVVLESDGALVLTVALNSVLHAEALLVVWK